VSRADEQDPPKRYDINLLIAHPSLSPVAITRGMRWRPVAAHEAGTPIRTPDGTVLPGRYFDTRWRYEWRHQTHGQHFAWALEKAVALLEKRAPFLRQVVASGGRVSLTVQFLDDGYFGDAIAPDLLTRIARLGISLGIEVFHIPQR
jgi:hypothetical protein